MSGFEENQEQNAKNMTFKSDGSGTRNDGFEGPLKVWFYTTYNQFFMKIKYYFMKSLKIEIQNFLIKNWKFWVGTAIALIVGFGLLS